MAEIYGKAMTNATRRLIEKSDEEALKALGSSSANRAAKVASLVKSSRKSPPRPGNKYDAVLASLTQAIGNATGADKETLETCLSEVERLQG